MVGRNLIPNGSFLTYKRRRTRKKMGSPARREDEVLSNRFRTLLSLFFFPCSIALSCAGFRGGSRCFEERPCASGSTSVVSLLRASMNKHRHLFAGLFGCTQPVPHCGFVASCWSFCCYIYIYTFVRVSLCRCLFAFLVSEGRVPGHIGCA